MKTAVFLIFMISDNKEEKYTKRSGNKCSEKYIRNVVNSCKHPTNREHKCHSAEHYCKGHIHKEGREGNDDC